LTHAKVCGAELENWLVNMANLWNLELLQVHQWLINNVLISQVVLRFYV